jgi:hypothetical protein
MATYNKWRSSCLSGSIVFLLFGEYDNRNGNKTYLAADFVFVFKKSLSSSSPAQLQQIQQAHK